LLGILLRDIRVGDVARLHSQTGYGLRTDSTGPHARRPNPGHVLNEPSLAGSPAHAVVWPGPHPTPHTPHVINLTSHQIRRRPILTDSPASTTPQHDRARAPANLLVKPQNFIFEPHRVCLAALVHGEDALRLNATVPQQVPAPSLEHALGWHPSASSRCA
jgi:hypothetical protein